MAINQLRNPLHICTLPANNSLATKTTALMASYTQTFENIFLNYLKAFHLGITTSKPTPT